MIDYESQKKLQEKLSQIPISENVRRLQEAFSTRLIRDWNRFWRDYFEVVGDQIVGVSGGFAEENLAMIHARAISKNIY